MTKKLYFDIHIKPKRGRIGYSVPAKGSRGDVAIQKACITGLIAEGDCDSVGAVKEITKEQYDHMLGRDRVKPEVLKFEERKTKQKMMRSGNAIEYDEWQMDVDIRANNMSEAKRLAWREVSEHTKGANLSKKKLRKLKINECENIGEHMFKCRSRI